MLIKPKHRPSLAVLVIGGLFVLVGLVFLVGSWGAYLTDTEIRDHGLSAEGHLVKKVFLFDAGGDSDYILEYWFMTKDGVKIYTRHHVSKSLWTAVRDGQTIEIKYSAGNPRRNFPDGEGVTSLAMTILASALGAVLTTLGGALIWSYFRKRSKITKPVNLL